MHWIDFHVLHGIPTALVRFPYPCMEIHPIAPFLLDAAVNDEDQTFADDIDHSLRGVC